MPAHKKKSDFLESDEGRECVKTLKEMTVNEAYNTEPSFSANAVLYPNHLIPFVDKHMEYLKNHPATDPQQYLSNLRLMTRIK